MDAVELVNLGLKEIKAPEVSSVRINLEDLVVTFSPIDKQSLNHSLYCWFQAEVALYVS